MRRYDIVVVGAGLAGLAFVLALRNAGLSVAVVDSIARLDGSRMNWGHDLQPNGLLALEKLGLLPEVERTGSRHDRYVLERFGGGRLSEWEYGMLEHPFPYAVCIRTHVLRQLMRHQAAGREYADMLIPARFRGLRRGGGEHEVELERDGALERIRTRLLVGADGPRSAVRDTIGIKARFKRGRHHWLDTIMRNDGDRVDAGYVYFGRGQYLGVVPTGPEQLVAFHLTAAGSHEEYRSRFRDIDDFRRTYAQWAPVLGAAVESYEDWSQSSHTLGHSMRALDWVADGAVLLGDSAVTVNPITSQGACIALEEGHALAGVVTDAFARGDLSAEALRPYEHACRRTAEQMQDMGDLCTRVFASRNVVLSWLKQRMLQRIDRKSEMKLKILSYFSGMHDHRIGWRDGLAAGGLWRRRALGHR
jgi:2-polyprenyl-6-methoxyphenol hydroxylase-like FAD-dependent oxidoreductase